MTILIITAATTTTAPTQVWDNLIVRPDAAINAGAVCLAALQSFRNRSSEHTHFFDNHCVMHKDNGFP
jgi:hypothetical protein